MKITPSILRPMDTETALPPTGLLCDMLRWPELTTISNPAPRFSWIVNDLRPNAFQTGYQILVASDIDLLDPGSADMWDSGETDPGGRWQTDPQSLHIPYRGKPLESDRTYHWKVRTWNARNEISPWSEVQAFSTGKIASGRHGGGTGTFRGHGGGIETGRNASVHESSGTALASDRRDDFGTVRASITVLTATQNIVRTEDAPVSVVDLGAGRTFVDFGRASLGTIRIELTCRSAGTILFRLGEVRSGRFDVNRNPGGSRRYREIEVEVSEGTHTYTLTIPPDERNTLTKRKNDLPLPLLMPKEIGEVLPFRFCVIETANDLSSAKENAAGSVGPSGPGSPSGLGGPSGSGGPESVLCRTPSSDAIRRLTAHYPFDDDAASFTSSSKILNDIWRMCHCSIKATSFLGLYVDGDRERIPYEADAYINQLGHYYCDRELAMARRTHEYLITHPNTPVEWLMFSIMLAWADYVYTGDSSSLARWYPDLEHKALTALAREDGLVSIHTGGVTKELLESVHAGVEWELKDLVDWPQGERDDYDMCEYNTVVNAFHAHVLELLGKIAEVLGNKEDAAEYRQRSRRVHGAMLDTMIDGNCGIFVDGDGSRHASLHANLFPLAFGLVPPEMSESVVRFIRSNGMACSVYAAQFLLEGLFESGAADHALSLLTATHERSWAHWIYDLDSTISLEAWDDRFKPNQDWNHAWGAAPANIIPRYIAGVRPEAPGFQKILIQPQPGSLSFVLATVPTIRGSVRVHAVRDSDKSFELQTETPANTSTRIVLPALHADDDVVYVDGRSIIASRRGKTLVIDNVGSGNHNFVRR